ncbi:DEHA2B09020p [Debaryomyces hansenii CBS767]|uniref:DEHA2B09020p n=1 Tax=Debaryomyces hansenii (strain ATCC 36239 / CBS 767 / BCRC 21394 / JCM 1990 / NBRC 0083 / IGC 2968) TaxID=284592 RepID=Q6BWS2_DEBHA|nr:DEHA2B09020p [Debaryomyces hansenii CBS767]CAG85351.2 DEHA2B09020p [Debaryomyces hansenii CBS767]|eukprot:XP_457347.2 DEHA2B09020p [Debaryomyces hansenii CBS767]
MFKDNNTLGFNQVKLENKVNNNILEEYESESVYEEVVDDRKYITKTEGNVDRTRSVIRDKGKSKLQELSIISVNIRNKENKALIDSGAQSNFITPELVVQLIKIMREENKWSRVEAIARETSYSLQDPIREGRHLQKFNTSLMK